MKKCRTSAPGSADVAALQVSCALELTAGFELLGNLVNAC